MTDSIRGRGLFFVHDALQELVDNPQRLERARNRFSDSSPWYYKSYPSGTTTCLQSPDPPDEDEEEFRRLDDRWYRLKDQYHASFPSEQFDAERKEEQQRILAANKKTPMMHSWYVFADSNVIKRAKETVKKRWVEQGIWNQKWEGMNPRNDDKPYGPWKHEEPLELESELESESDTVHTVPARSLFRTPEGEPQSDAELQLMADRRIIRERQREASRPFHQFMYQVSKTRERMQSEPAGPEQSEWSGAQPPERSPPLDSAVINTKAYENVKSTWTKRGIWYKKWGTLPGMSWKHEQPLEEVLAEEMGADYARLQTLLRKRGGDSEVTEIPPPPTNVSGPLPRAQSPSQSLCPPSAEPSARPLFQSPPQQPVQSLAQPPAQSQGESNSGFAPGLPNTSQAELPASPGPAGFQNNNTNHISPTPNSPSSSTESRPDDHMATEQRPRRAKSAPSQQRNGRDRPAAGDTALGPDSASPRRSIRLRTPRPEAPTDQAAVASAGPSNGSSLARGGSRKTTVGNSNTSSLTRPSRVSKRLRRGTRNPKSK